MKWYTIMEKKPPINEDILIKINDPWTKYYVVRVEFLSYNEYTFTEANGEQYATWSAEEVEYWCPLEELDKTLPKN